MRSGAEFMSVPMVPPPKEIRFLVWPLWHEGLSAWLTFAACLGVSALVFHTSHAWQWGLVAFAALQIAGWRLWLPVTYRFDDRGVHQRVLAGEQSFAWRSIARLELVDNTLVLEKMPESYRIFSPCRIAIPLGPYRSQVLEMLVRQLPNPSPISSSPIA